MSERDEGTEQTDPLEPRPDPLVLARFRFLIADDRPGSGRRAAARGAQQLPDRLCRAAVDALAVDGSAIAVYLGAGVAVPVGASDQEANRAEGLQFTLAEGPCLQAYSDREPVLVPDIGRPGSAAWANWPTYAAEFTRHTGYRAVFAFPLICNGLGMGSFSLYRRSPGAAGAPADLTAIAALIAARLLEAETFAGLRGHQEHPWIDGPSSHRRKQVWVAQGLTMQANRLTPAQALDLLRARAYTAERLVDDIAEDIVTGRLSVPTLAGDH
jgi:hypothetical protein